MAAVTAPLVRNAVITEPGTPALEYQVKEVGEGKRTTGRPCYP
jgi:hypothetical protein